MAPGYPARRPNFQPAPRDPRRAPRGPDRRYRGDPRRFSPSPPTRPRPAPSPLPKFPMETPRPQLPQVPATIPAWVPNRLGWFLRRNPWGMVITTGIEMWDMLQPTPWGVKVPAGPPSYYPGWAQDFKCQQLDWALADPKWVVDGPYNAKGFGTCGTVPGSPGTFDGYDGGDSFSPVVRVRSGIPRQWWNWGRWSRLPGTVGDPPPFADPPVPYPPARPAPLAPPMAPTPYAPPWFDPFAVPPFTPQPFPVPPPYPLIPDLPVQRPDRSPAEQPDRGYEPKPDPEAPPRPRPAPVPSPEPWHPPTIDIEPGVKPAPGKHYKEPPEGGDREKKGPISGKLADTWLGVMDGMINTFTETDDFVAAVYKSLHWSVRRWKGRDGVWRDRDITTTDRLKRLNEHADKISISRAIYNLAQNHGMDAAVGGIGKAMGEAVGRAVDTGYWRGARGLQAGGANQRKVSWDEVYERLKNDARIRDEKFNRYKRWVLDKDGKWRLETVVRKDKTQIPWLRREKGHGRRVWVPIKKFTTAWFKASNAERRAGGKFVITGGYYYADG